MEVSGKIHASVALTPRERKNQWYPTGGPQSGSGEKKNL
jgi:hypothetical protein